MEIIGLLIAFLVPIGIAVWTVRSSAQDTAKKIAVLEESTTKQVESVKELTQIQIELSILQTEIQLKEMDDYHKILSQRVEEEAKKDKFLNQYGSIDAIRQEEKRTRDMMDEQLKTIKQVRNFRELRAKLIELKEKLGGK